jgi:hypothetical protein
MNGEIDMDTIKIRTHENGPWVAVTLLAGERPGWVEVADGDASLWVQLEDVHPADQVALMFEAQAKQRYKWVPKEDLDQPG